MRTITIKQLYKSLSRELGNLPFHITKGGVPIAVVLGLDQKVNVSLDQEPKSKKKSRPKKEIISPAPMEENPYDPYFRPMLKQGKKGKK